jgi:6-phosphogluconate dehydrogenase
MVAALDDDPGLSKVAGYAEDSGEGRWTVEAGIEHAVATPAITAALYARFVSRQDDSPAMQAVAAMRNQFGGHAVRTPAPKGGDVEDGGTPDQTETSKKAGAGSGQEPGES